jgi:uncharacterized protein (DUF433 family)
VMPMSRLSSKWFRARWRAAVSRDPSICHGIECFRGTRIIVAVVLDLIYQGYSDAEILQQFPTLAPKHLALANKAVRLFDSLGVGKKCKICGKHTRYGTYKMGIKAGGGFGYFVCEECEENGKDQTGGLTHG